VSLLLDALKEAEKSRKGLEAALEPTPVTPAIEEPIVLDLELNPSEVSKSQVSPPELPSEETSREKTPLANNPSRRSDTTTSPSTHVTKPKPTIKPTLQYSSLQNTRVATDVFQNRKNTNKKTKSRLPLLLLLLLLLLLGFLAIYFFVMNNEDSISTGLGINSQYELSSSVEPQPDLTKILDQNSVERTVESAIDSTIKLPNMNLKVSTTSEKQLINPTQKNLSLSTQQVTAPATNKRKSSTPTESHQPTSGSISSHNMSPSNPDFQITKRQLSNRSLSSLSVASDALKQGDLATAEKTYRKVLKQIPSNVTAMAGLATTLIQQGRLKEGQAMYYKVLDKDPENLLANIGLINLIAVGSSNLSAGSQLKQLLTKHPKQAYLHASLGNFYARKNEWASAQGAYFEAFALDTENPDYAFNLAISLDQIGKPELATKYYAQALKLVEKTPSRFIKADVERRMNELKGNAQ